jgi:hypothetical protein
VTWGQPRFNNQHHSNYWPELIVFLLTVAVDEKFTLYNCTEMWATNKRALNLSMRSMRHLPTFAASHHRYVCTDHANVLTHNFNELQIHSQPRSTEAHRWLSLAQWHFPPFRPSLVFARAHSYRNFIPIQLVRERVKEIMLLFYTCRPQNPLRYFYDLILRSFSDCKGKDSVILCVNMCDMTLMSGEHLAVLSYLEQSYWALWLS